VVFPFSIGFVVEAIVSLTFTISVGDSVSKQGAKEEVAKLLRISPAIVKFYLDDGKEFFLIGKGTFGRAQNFQNDPCVSELILLFS
jgi:hypothetical protein